MSISSRKPRRSRRILLDTNVLTNLIKRIVPVARPEKIILFGSAARGEMGPNSDVDLLVIKGGKYQRRRVTTAIYPNLHGAPVAVDVVVASHPRKWNAIAIRPAWSFARH